MTATTIIDSAKKVMISMESFVERKWSLTGNMKQLNQRQTDHTNIILPFIKMRCFIGYATIKKRSTEIAAIVIMETDNVPDQRNCKIQ